MNPTNTIIAKFLAYQDAPLTPGQKRTALQGTLSSASAKKYAKVLKELEGTSQLAKAEAIGQQLLKECLAYLKTYKLTPSPYTLSKTWAIWDIAKQLYLEKNPAKSDPSRYHLGNPLTDKQVQIDILDRHLGWELYMKLREDDTLLSKVKDKVIPEIRSLLAKHPKPENGTLSSSDLTQLGRLVRGNYKKGFFGLFS
jgi:hypothetical protein